MALLSALPSKYSFVNGPWPQQDEGPVGGGARSIVAAVVISATGSWPAAAQEQGEGAAHVQDSLCGGEKGISWRLISMSFAYTWSKNG